MSNARHALAILFVVSSAFAHAQRLVLTSPELKPGANLSLAQVLSANGCAGENKSPALSWSGAPVGTQSFALTFYDRDAPTGSGWWHWVVFNIPASQRNLPAGAGDAKKPLLPAGAIQSRTDFGVPGFGGACPPAGAKAHRYVFTLHALRVPMIEAGPDATAAQVGYLVHLNELGRATLEARYGRP
jgi:Raf kinase inhibitor-like YbhB/YbcL family protein